MKRIFLAAALLWVQSASAQSPPSYHFTVTAPQVDIIGRALGREPYIEVKDLIAQLNAQIAAQNAAAARPQEKPSEVPPEPRPNN